MSTNTAPVSSEPPTNSNLAVTNGVTSEPLHSKTETLVDDSRVSGGQIGDVMDKDEKVGGDVVVQGSIDEARVIVDEIGTVMSNSELVSDKSIAAESVGSESETLTMEASADRNGDGDIAVQDSVDDSRGSVDEKGVVMDKDDKLGGDVVVQGSIDEARVIVDEIGTVMSNSELVSDKSIAADSVGSESETLMMEASADRNGDGDIAVQDSVDDSRGSGDEKGVVMENVEKVNEVKIGADSVGLETETLTIKSPDDRNGDGDSVVQYAIDDSRASKDEKGILMENIEKVDDSVDEKVNNAEKEGERKVTDGDIDDDSVDVSKDYKDEKVSYENEANDAEKEGEHKVTDGDIDVDHSVDVSKDYKDEKVSYENEVNNAEKEGEHKVTDGDIDVDHSIDDSKDSKDEKVSYENEANDEEKEGEYKVTDIVWAKVKNYPWWPGQIFDPSSATDKAKKFSNKKGLLVGYFGDQSFAWNKPSNIKPFRKNFRKLEKQSNSKPFLHAVDCALDEVSRRVDFGLACSCLSKEVYDKVKTQVFVNAGIREEHSKIDGGDRFSTGSTFKPVKVVQSVQDLAREHFDGYSRLEMLSVRTQLLAFFRWKGYYQLQAQNIVDGPDNKLEAESELPLTEENKVVEDETLASIGKKVSSKKRKPDVSDSDDYSAPRKKERSLENVTPKGNSSAKRSKKNISKIATVDDDVVKEEKRNAKPASVGKKVSSKKRKPDVSDSDDSVPLKKEGSLKIVTPKGNSSSKRSKKDVSKNATVDDGVIKEENGDEKPASAGKKVSSKKRKPDDSDSDDSAPRKKERSVTNVTPKGKSSVKRSKKGTSKKATVGNVIKEEKGNGTDNKLSSISSPKMFRIGDSICKIAKQISESPSILKKESEKSKNDDHSATLRKTDKKDGQPVEAIQTEE